MAEDATAFSGTWRSRGYGWELEAGAHGFTVHDITAISRSLADSGGPGSFAEAFTIDAHHEDGSVRLRHRGDVTGYVFDPVLPASRAETPPINRDAVRNFDVFHRIFADHYAFFALRGVDWQAVCAAARRRLTARSSDDDLRATLSDCVAPLRDAHVSVTGDDFVLDVTSPVRERKLLLQEAFGVPAWARDRMAYTRGIQSAFGAMFLNGRLRATSNAMMIHGEIAPSIGYLTVFGEFGHADTARARAALDLPRPRLEAASFLADEVAAVEQALDEVAEGLASSKAIIVDARLNYGGYDRIALAIAGLFADRQAVSYRKRAWTPYGFVNHQSITVEPRRRSLSGRPVYVLTSRQTASAGEILVLGLMACPNVTRVGEATLGILSDNLYKRLPNGWELSLSNEIYEAPDGALYEAAGIPPDIETPVFDAQDVRGGFRHAVTRAVQLAMGRIAP